MVGIGALELMVSVCPASTHDRLTAAAALQCPPPRFEVGDFGGEADRGWPGGTSVADINGDGALDLFVANNNLWRAQNFSRGPGGIKMPTI
jgi:hypothetical protein